MHDRHSHHPDHTWHPEDRDAEGLSVGETAAEAADQL
ncbi:hypothetical protein BH23GEM7_BH23GEM7_29880 [soil metagenome]